jgi:hypothetical protein
MFFASIPGSERSWPFAFAARHRARLGYRVRQRLDLVAGAAREIYEHRLFNFLAVEGAWERDGCFRAVCGLSLGAGRVISGTAELGFAVFGMEEEFRQCFLNLSPFVVGLAGASMHDAGMAVLAGDESQIHSEEQLRALTRTWVDEGFRLRVAMGAF